MPVWQKAHKLAAEVFNLTVTLPRSEDYGLTSQIRKSSNGVAACIAEGFGRSTKKDKSNFYTQRLLDEYNDLIHELNKLIKSLE